MSIWMTFIVALKALRRNAMRTALTALGMIIGVAAVIVMVAIGTGASSSIQAQIRSAGSNIVMVTAGSGGFGPVRQGQGAVTTLTADDAEAIRREIPGVRYVSPGLNTRTQIVAATGNWNTQVQGAGPDLAAIRSWPTQFGSFFTEDDVTAARKVAVLGSVVRDQLFGVGSDPTGEIVRIKNQPFQVIGVLTSKGQAAMGQDQDDTVLVPFTTVQKRLMGVQHVTNITVSAENGVPLDTMTDQIAELLRLRHKLQPGTRRRLPGTHARRNGECAHVDDEHDDVSARRHRGRVAHRRWHRHHEHHARVGDRADARDRSAPRCGRARPRRAAAVSRRVDRAQSGWRRHRHCARLRDFVRCPTRNAVVRGCHPDGGGDVFRRCRGCRRVLRVLSSAQGGAAESDRRAALRVAACPVVARKARRRPSLKCHGRATTSTSDATSD
jgi:hypothetical protein